MTADRHAELMGKMATELASATDGQLVMMHALAYAILRQAPTSDSPAIIKAMSAIEVQFERRDIPFCGECGRPDGMHEPDFCSAVADRSGGVPT